jgi:RimJ/RimL family protein N-acetyltransferase
MKNPILLRPWRDDDLDPFVAMNADTEVMRFFQKPLTETESGGYLTRIRSIFDEQGWGLWAVEVDGAFAGLTGLAAPSFSAHFTPCIEIGWRFRREYWGRGIAYAAASAARTFAFEELKLRELVSFTTVANTRSRRLMERLGLSTDSEDNFLHPLVPLGNPLRRHVLYRISNTSWQAATSHGATQPEAVII